MPFLMSPKTWRKFYKPKEGKLKERSHKDGIMIGYNSNEALEETGEGFKNVEDYLSRIKDTPAQQTGIFAKESNSIIIATKIFNKI